MKSFLHKIAGGHGASASVVDGKLILSFPSALTPVVWQMDLSTAKASALEVQEKNGGYALILKTPKGENLDIAPFDDRTKAVQGLMAASNALENAYGHIHPANSNKSESYKEPRRRQKKGHALPIMVSVLLVFLLFLLWNAASLQAPQQYQQANSVMDDAASNAAHSSGVPVSADDFLKGR